jgi:hypothetical protein
MTIDQKVAVPVFSYWQTRASRTGASLRAGMCRANRHALPLARSRSLIDLRCRDQKVAHDDRWLPLRLGLSRGSRMLRL